jgi:dTDP-4-dehydrorhamnose reductase
MRILVTGAAGQLGGELCEQLGSEARPVTRAEFPLESPEVAVDWLRRERPETVVHCAAYTAVDRAEEEPDRCFAINAHAVRVLAEAARALGIYWVQISTDYVFGADSKRDRPYGELDQPGPQGVYARSKLMAEEYVTAVPRHLIVRTCGLYSARPGSVNFPATILRLANDRPRLRVVADQRCSPTYVPHLALALRHLIARQAVGVFHVAGGGDTTWHEFAVELLRLAGRAVPVDAITTEQFGARAERPRYSVLDCGKYLALGGPPLPPWREALAEYLAARQAGISERA